MTPHRVLDVLWLMLSCVQFIDTVGHYARPDMLSLLVNPEAAKHVTLMK